jgi:CheY-like chemotaxis protein
VTQAVLSRRLDLAVLDLQSGSMGAMAVTMNLRLDHDDGRGPHVPVLMLLDRAAAATRGGWSSLKMRCGCGKPPPRWRAVARGGSRRSDGAPRSARAGAVGGPRS